MRRFYRLRSFKCPPDGLLLAGLIIGVLGGSASAEERFVVKRDGRKVRIVRSESELAVTLKERGKGDATRLRMAADGTGMVADVPWAIDSRYKILRVPKATAMKRAMVADDPAIDEVFPIYRFADSDSAVISTGTIALRLRPDSDKYTLPKLLDDYRLTVVESVDGLDGTYIVRPSEEMGDEVLRAEVLAVDRRVLWAQPNFRSPVYFAQISPSDPFFTRQWHLSNTGQMGGTPGADVNAPAAWLLGAEGQDVLIGMLDDACDVDHPDLVSNYLGIGHDPTEPSTAPGFDDPRPKVVGDRHGTAVMGLAVARANTLGVRGVSHLSQFTVSRGLGQLPTDAELANAYLFARQQDVDVHINSWGLGGGVPIPAIIEDAIETAFIEGRDLDGDGGDPPRGMIVLFASGNGVDRNGDGIIDNDGIGALLGPGDELSTLPTVIGVGATNDRDLIASYSNFGSQIDVLAPGGGDFAGITTTDVSDDGFIDGGFNIGGVNVSGETDIEGTGLYTGGFGGTSAACPIAAGVAALTLSISPLLSATDVHLILKHTSAKVSPNDAVYNDITSRSLRYGYGRVDAVAAVMAAQDSLSNGGRTWPSRPARTTVSNQTGQLTWLQNGDPLEFRGTISDNDPNSETENVTVLRTTDEFLVLESDAPFVFLPEDGKCYSKEQIGCGSTEPEPLPLNVSVLRVGCSLVCGTGSTGLCEAGAPQCVGFLLPSGAKHFAIYARSNIGRYSFGVSVDTDGNILDSGELPPRAEAGTIPGGGGGVDADVGPKVSIEFSPREGESPLTVSFRGNAASVLPIDADRTAWDFDIDDGIVVDATTRNATNIYLLNPGETPTNQKTFIARLTMFDVEGNIGFAQAAISVTAAGIDPDTGADADAELRIIISTPGSVGSDIDSGQSPLRVELSVDAGSLVGTVESVFWDLGDGTTATSRFVSHTYVNNTGISLRIPITATVTIQTGSETSIRVVSRRVTVESGDPSDLTVNPVCTEADGCGATGPGGEATPCGVLNMVPLLFSLVSLLWIRRSRRSAF